MIKRKGSPESDAITETYSIKLKREVEKLERDYNDLYLSAIQLKEQINQTIEMNKAQLIEDQKYKNSLLNNARRFILIFYVKQKFIDEVLMENFTKCANELHKKFDPDFTLEKYLGSEEIPASFINYMKNRIFFDDPLNKGKKLLNLVLSEMEKKLKIHNNKKICRRIRKYLLSGLPDPELIKNQIYDEIKKIKDSVDGIYKFVYGDYGYPNFNKGNENSTLADIESLYGIFNDKVSDESYFSDKTLQNILVLDNYDLMFSWHASIY